MGEPRSRSLRRRPNGGNPPQEARACSECRTPYVENGDRSTTVIEIEVKAHTRKIVRPRWRRGCQCACSPREVTAPPVARVFQNTPYGVSVWACVLYERFVGRRPIHRVSGWLGDMGLKVSPGTLADSVKRFVPLFEPLAVAILAHQNTAPLRHADETGWRVQAYRERGRSSRAWLWTSVSQDAVYYLIDPSRSAEVAKRLFASVEGTVILVCDRYSSYQSLARQLDGKVILQWCWAHQRRSFLDCAAGHVRLTRWCRRWIERIARIYRLNDARLEHFDPDLERQTPAFDAAQGELKQAVEALFASAETELAGLSDRALKAKPLRSLVNHREGLCVFVDKPYVPPDNNLAERLLRGAVIGRSLSFGSDSEKGAEFTAMMYTVTVTLAMNGIDVRPLAWGMAGRVRGQRRQTAAGPLALAAVVDERGTQARPDGAGMTGDVECRYHGRDFTAAEMALLRGPHRQPRAAVAARPVDRVLPPHRLGQARRRAQGHDGPGRAACHASRRTHRVAAAALEAGPAQAHRVRTRYRTAAVPAPHDPRRGPPVANAHRRGTAPGKAGSGMSSSPGYHYLGHTTLVGAQMRYAVHDGNGAPLALLGFSTAAWTLAPRDDFIGWSPETREKNLPLVVDNPRFLILPWIRIPNLGSHLLALVRRRLPRDWTERYNTTPVLIETFVETPRYTGARVYRASGWTRVGTTQGRGRYDRHKQRAQPKKGHLAPPPPKRLETHPQSLKSSCPKRPQNQPHRRIAIPRPPNGYPVRRGQGSA